MNRETIFPESQSHWLELRTRDLTSTDISALFDCSPYLTRFELWHRKKSCQIVELTETERMKWGTRLQDSIAQGIAADMNWHVRRMQEYMRITESRLGSSFDYRTDEALLEIKNVDALQFRDGWIVDGDTLEAPPHIELQVQHQMLVSGVNLAYIGALIGGNRVTVVERRADPEIHSAIITRAAEFWRSIDDGKEPAPEFPRDAAAVIKLYQFAEPGKECAATPAVADMAARYRELGAAIKPLEDEREALKARIILAMGDAERCRGDRFTISAGVVGPAHIEYERPAYRRFSINWRKEK